MSLFSYDTQLLKLNYCLQIVCSKSVSFQSTADGVPGAPGMPVPQHVEGAQGSGQDL